VKRTVLVMCILGFSKLAGAQSAPPLASAQSFVVLGASTVTSAGPTVIVGDLGVSPGTAVTGFPPGTISGGTIHSNDPAASSAQADAHTAYNDLAAELCGTNLSGLILGTSPGATTLVPGVYCFASSAQLTGTLTLSGAGPYIFEIGSTLITATGSAVVLTNGATAANVFWQVGTSATLGDNSVIAGSVLAAVSITLDGGTNVEGRVIALGGAVTLISNTLAAVQNRQFLLESSVTEDSAGFTTSSDPNATLQCTPSAPCAQQLSLIFNTVNQQLASLGNPNVLSAINSVDDPDGSFALTISNLCSSTDAAITVANQDGSQYLFSGTGTGNPCLGTPASPITGSYSLSTGETGLYTIYVFPNPSGTYTGTFNDAGNSGNNHHNAPNNGSDTLSLSVNPDSSVTATLVVSAGELCSAQTSALAFFSTTQQAIDNGVDPADGISGVSVGDAVLMSLADGSGNLVSVVMTDQDANGAELPAGSLYVTGFSASGVCAGTFFYDRPFTKGAASREVRHVRHHGRHELAKQLREFEDRIRNHEARFDW
jgi:ice-binding like protein